ncbi:MAG: transcription-repair coupling factor [Candidatus Neomarinimicrobiota bacterium]
MVSRETVENLGGLLATLRSLDYVDRIDSALTGNGAAFGVAGLNQSCLSAIVLALWQARQKTLICVCGTLSLAEELYHIAFNLIPRDVFYFPEPVDSTPQVPGFVHDWERYHSDLAENLSPDFTGLVFTTATAMETPLFKDRPETGFHVARGERLNGASLLAALESWGYERVDHVYTPKSVAVRGGIIDVFMLASALPFRIELFGDEVESVRSFNPISQRTVEQLTVVEISPPATAPAGATKNLLAVLPENIQILSVEQTVAGFSLSTSPGIDCQFVNCVSTSFVRQSWEAKLEILTRAAGDLGLNNFFVFIDSAERIAALNNKLPFVPRYIPAPLQQGFLLSTAGLACFTHAELFQVSSRLRRRWSVAPEKSIHKPIGSLESIDWGDLLVHQDFGVGIYRGLDRVQNKTTVQECIKIEYADGGHVYVPVDKFSRVHKYISSGEADPKLSTLGSAQWERQKLKTRKSAASVINELVDLYAQRNHPRGFSYSPDRELVTGLEESFAYEETPDQTTAIESVFNDLSKPTPMDRLVCGDVGFGKTEVALRAVMNVISGGYKVAFLAPTTILADQHYLTAKNRLEPLGVRVELLSRFRSSKEQKTTLAALASGTADLVVGTHRLLSADVVIPRLGLLIVDEEHRFGVKHKERIKQIKKNVDVLTLTATPIPRTLQQSLVGIYSISKIETPPKERLPVRTVIQYFDWNTINDSLRRELNRNGQAFFLHNNIDTLAFYRDRIQESFPAHSVAIANGQMPSRLLENTMLDFAAGNIDVLVCTTIIESGLDIPNVNTIIINEAHRFGLAQIYQIRGRVGRSNRQAFCHLVLPRNHKLTKTAFQRLKAIEYFSNLGSGYDIALKDLEIRGAGNLFGFEQSGQIAAVGFEMYCKILKDAVDEVLNQPQEKEKEAARILFQGDALIPADYMAVIQDRLFFYQKLADAKELSSIDNTVTELQDRFGRFPEALSNLIAVATIRVESIGSGLSEIQIGPDFVKGTVTEKTRFNDSVEMMAVLESQLKVLSRPYRFAMDRNKNLIFEIATSSVQNSFETGKTIVKLFSQSHGK